eukprot:Pompholyxophrys_punicea_v1_NODE_103_length_3477_cov_5.215371.p6 type:complete len:121 gc:universal NODE_103_length_3477_cov_5.215371:1471-1109(-)
MWATVWWTRKRQTVAGGSDAAPAVVAVAVPDLDAGVGGRVAAALYSAVAFSDRRTPRPRLLPPPPPPPPLLRLLRRRIRDLGPHPQRQRRRLRSPSLIIGEYEDAFTVPEPILRKSHLTR